MFFFDTLKKILSGELPTLAYSASATQTAHTSIVDTLPFAAAVPAFEAGRVVGHISEHHQQRTLSLKNGTVVGYLTGQIGELLGNVQIDAFEGLPNWLPSLSIRLTLTAAEGSCRVTMHQPADNEQGALAQLTAPGSLETQAAILNGKLRISFEALTSPAKGIHYELTII